MTAKRQRHTRRGVRAKTERYRVRLVFYCAILLGLAVFAYANSIQAPFVGDDLDGIVNEPAIRPPFSLGAALSTNRPVVTATLSFNYWIGELDERGYHVFNILAHALCGLLFFGLARHLLREPACSRDFGPTADAVALFAAGVFTVHPIQTESVTYTIQRSEILGTIAILGALWSAALLSRRHSPLLWGSLLVSGLAGAWSKEIVVILPVLFALYDWCFIAQGRVRDMPNRRGVYLPLALIAVFSLAWGFSGEVNPTTAGFEMESMSSWDYMRMQPGVLLYYARLIIWPDSLCFDCGLWKPWPVLGSLLGASALVPAVILGAIVVVALRVRERLPLVTFCVLGAGIVLVPSSSFLPLADVYVEHRLYLPIGLLALLVGGCSVRCVSALGNSPLRSAATRALPVAAALAVVALVPLTVSRNRSYADPVVLWSDSVAKAPENYRAQYHLARGLMERGAVDAAIGHYELAIRSGLRLSGAYVGLGNAYTRVGRLQDAVTAMKSAKGLAPGSSVVHRNLAALYAKVGRITDAVDAAEKAVELDSESVRGRGLLADLYQASGRTEDALVQYEVALRIEPTNTYLKKKVNELGPRSE